MQRSSDNARALTSAKPTTLQQTLECRMDTLPPLVHTDSGDERVKVAQHRRLGIRPFRVRSRSAPCRHGRATRQERYWRLQARKTWTREDVMCDASDDSGCWGRPMTPITKHRRSIYQVNCTETSEMHVTCNQRVKGRLDQDGP